MQANTIAQEQFDILRAQEARKFANQVPSVPNFSGRFFNILNALNSFLDTIKTALDIQAQSNTNQSNAANSEHRQASGTRSSSDSSFTTPETGRAFQGRQNQKNQSENNLFNTPSTSESFKPNSNRRRTSTR